MCVYNQMWHEKCQRKLTQNVSVSIYIDTYFFSECSRVRVAGISVVSQGTSMHELDHKDTSAEADAS